MSFNIFDHNYYTLSKGGNYSVKARISVRAYLSDDVFQTNPPPYAPHDAGSSGDIESNIVNFAIISLSTVDHITISPASSTIVAGRSQAYATQAFDVYNNSTDVTPQTLTISPNGSCSGNACTATVAGPHSVQATYSGKTATANLQVIPGGAAKLAFGVQPSNTTVGVTISPPITVQIVDSNGNLITSSTAPVTLGIGNNPGGGTLSGTKKRNAINGVATFNDLSINKVGNGYTLVAASSSGLTGTTSSTFNITAKTYLLTVTKAGTGSGNVTASTGTLVWNGNVGTATYNAGTKVTLTATPNQGSTFIGWSASCSGTGNCSVIISGANCTVNICGPCKATATFKKK
jgi:hypothetical protein